MRFRKKKATPKPEPRPEVEVTCLMKVGLPKGGQVAESEYAAKNAKARYWMTAPHHGHLTLEDLILIRDLLDDFIGVAESKEAAQEAGLLG